jgi:hypothetical protein
MREITHTKRLEGGGGRRVSQSFRFVLGSQRTLLAELSVWYGTPQKLGCMKKQPFFLVYGRIGEFKRVSHIPKIGDYEDVSSIVSERQY